jgi:hypothetical protein
MRLGVDVRIAHQGPMPAWKRHHSRDRIHVGSRTLPLLNIVPANEEASIHGLRPAIVDPARTNGILLGDLGLRWPGSTGSISSGYSDRSAISGQPKLRPISMTHSQSLPRQRDLNPRASGKTGAVQVMHFAL